MSMKKYVKHAVMVAVDTVLPPRCVVSGEAVDRQGMIAPHIWAAIDFWGAPLCATCGVPFDFEVSGSEAEDMLCVGCLERSPPYASARAALRYNDASRSMILGFKHADQLHAAVAFVPWLQKAGAEMLREADLIVPVPLHRWRLAMRRYNQAAIMAQKLSMAVGLPVNVNVLRRIRATQSQGHLKVAARHKNVKRAFDVCDEAAVLNKVIILIDDVYTTGATAKECTHALLKAGAADVHILTLARVVRN